jgi:hypothetical protein
VASDREFEFPLVGVSLGNQDPEAPTLGLFGGVHGLERIGSQVVLSLMRSFSELSLWDRGTQNKLSQCRLIFFPLINPSGVFRQTRSNGRGVDLMRNSPIDALETPSLLVGGQNLSPKLPWFRGYQQPEVEFQAVMKFCEAQFYKSQNAITVDFHSGFGIQDQIWFPWAKTTKPFPHLPQMYRLTNKFEMTHPHHFYRIEPQAKNYTTHGDLWDHVYAEFMKVNASAYLPLCVEMGSWLWVRKNPIQLFSSLGPFNPLKPHRLKRILRRHHTFFDFLLRSIENTQSWGSLSPEEKSAAEQKALEKWYS